MLNKVAMNVVVACICSLLCTNTIQSLPGTHAKQAYNDYFEQLSHIAVTPNETVLRQPNYFTKQAGEELQGSNIIDRDVPIGNIKRSTKSGSEAKGVLNWLKKVGGIPNSKNKVKSRGHYKYNITSSTTQTPIGKNVIDTRPKISGISVDNKTSGKTLNLRHKYIQSIISGALVKPSKNAGENFGLNGLFTTDTGSRAGSIVSRWFNSNIRQNLTAVSPACRRAMRIVKDSLEDLQMWAIKVKDSIGRPPSGQLKSTGIWVGDYVECQEVSETVNPEARNTSLNMVAPFHFKYCQVTGSLDSLLVPNFKIYGNIGACVPVVCSHEDVGNAINQGLYVMPRDMQAGPTYCQDPNFRDWNLHTITTTCVLGVIAFLVALATTYDVIICQKGNKKLCLSITGGQAPHRYTSLPTDPEHEENKSDAKKKGPDDIYGRKPWKLAEGVILAFSAYRNGKEKLHIEKASPLECMHGVRSLAMCYVLLTHLMLLQISTVDKMADVLHSAGTFWFQIIIHDWFSVDAFFVLSGALITYKTLKMLEDKGLFINWPAFYLYRYWRITIPYALTMMFYANGLTKYFSQGVFSRYVPNGETCRSWWQDLLYIVNLQDPKDYCMLWGWYLDNDMQFFWVTPLILIPLYRWPYIGVSMVALLMAGSATWCAVVTYQNGFSPGGLTNLTTMMQDQYVRYLYVSPFARCGPYLVGIILGFSLFKTKCEIKLHWAWRTLGWMLSTAAGIFVFWSTRHISAGGDPNTAFSVVYNSFARPLFGGCVAWVLFCCITGNAPIVNWILTWREFQRISRVSFVTYLVHPIIYYVVCHTFTSHPSWTFDSLASRMFSYIVFPIIASFFISLLIEAPVLSLQKIIFRKYR